MRFGNLLVRKLDRKHLGDRKPGRLVARPLAFITAMAIIITSALTGLPNNAAKAATKSQAIIGYITWQNLSQRWSGGSGLAAERSLDMLSDIVAPAVNPSSASKPTIIGMHGGNLETLRTVANAGHAYGCLVGPYLYTDKSGKYGPTLTQIVSAGTLDALVSNIKNLLNTYGLDGITLDPEDGSSPSTLHRVLKALRSGLPSDKYIDITGRPYTAPNLLSESAQYLRYIQVMTYDMGWNPNTAGYPQSSVEATQSGMRMWSSAGFPKSKLVAGVPAYGRTAYVATLNPKQESMQYVDILGQNTNAYKLDYATLKAESGLTRSFWWGGGETARSKTRWTMDNGYAGIMIFALGYDKLNDSRSLVRTIYETINSGTVAASTAPKVVTVGASGVSASSAKLTGSLTDTGSASTINLSFEYGTTTQYGNVIQSYNALSVPGMFDATVAGLTENTLYHFRAKAIGTSTAYGVDMTFMTSASGGTNPVQGIVLNPSFEADLDLDGAPDGWTVNFPYMKQSADKSNDGTRALKFEMKAVETTHRRAYSSLIPVAQGVTYTGSVDTFYSVLNKSASAYLMISYFTTADGSGTQYFDALRVEIPEAVGSWKTSTFKWVPPSGTRSFKILLYVGNTSISTLYWDDIKMSSTTP